MTTQDFLPIARETMIALVLFCVAAVSADPLSKIVNGVDATEGDHPHQVSLLINGNHACGGSIINKDWIITAAHCTENSDYSYSVVVNEFDRSKPDTNEQTISVATIVNHENYGQGAGAYPNDISLLKLSSSIQGDFTAIQIPTNDNTFAGLTCTITGWGRLYGNGPIPNILQKTTGTIQTNTACRTTWGNNINSGHICIHNSNTGSCNGDSGGPMECNVNGVTVLAGVTSWGASGCITSYPSVYTRVSVYRDWILATISA